MKSIKKCTLIGVEGVEKRIPQFLKAADICQHYIEFGDVKLLSPFDLKRKVKSLESDSGKILVV